MAAQDPRKVFSKSLMEIGEAKPEVLIVSCDSASGSGMSEFMAKWPERYVEIGISEQTAVGVSAGLALNGFIPITSAIAPFISMRPYEQVRDDCGYVNTNVKLIGSSSGLSHSTLGSTHIAIEDMTLMRSIPNMVILNPGDAYEVDMSMKKAVEHFGPVYIRMPRHPMEDIVSAEQRNFEIGKAEVLSEGDIMFIATGTVVKEAQKAAELLNKDGVSAGVIDVLCVKPLDKELIAKYAKKSKMLVSVEEHSEIGGLGGAVAECIAPVANTAPLHIFAIPDGSKNVGPYRELLGYYGLTSDKLYERVLKLVKG